MKSNFYFEKFPEMLRRNVKIAKGYSNEIKM